MLTSENDVINKNK